MHTRYCVRRVTRSNRRFFRTTSAPSEFRDFLFFECAAMAGLPGLFLCWIVVLLASLVRSPGSPSAGLLSGLKRVPVEAVMNDQGLLTSCLL